MCLNLDKSNQRDLPLRNKRAREKVKEEQECIQGKPEFWLLICMLGFVLCCHNEACTIFCFFFSFIIFFCHFYLVLFYFVILFYYYFIFYIYYFILFYCLLFYLLDLFAAHLVLQQLWMAYSIKNDKIIKKNNISKNNGNRMTFKK